CERGSHRGRADGRERRARGNRIRKHRFESEGRSLVAREETVVGIAGPKEFSERAACGQCILTRRQGQWTLARQKRERLVETHCRASAPVLHQSLHAPGSPEQEKLIKRDFP